jgi:hypothetical protein
MTDLTLGSITRRTLEMSAPMAGGRIIQTLQGASKKAIQSRSVGMHPGKLAP